MYMYIIYCLNRAQAAERLLEEERLLRSKQSIKNTSTCTIEQNVHSSSSIDQEFKEFTINLEREKERSSTKQPLKLQNELLEKILKDVEDLVQNSGSHNKSKTLVQQFLDKVHCTVL